MYIVEKARQTEIAGTYDVIVAGVGGIIGSVLVS